MRASAPTLPGNTGRHDSTHPTELKEPRMKTLLPSPLLKVALVVDGGSSAAMAAFQLLQGPAWASRFELPPSLLIDTGLFFLAYATLLFGIALRARVPVALIGLIVAGNVAWAVMCVLLPLVGVLTVSTWGLGYLLLQAVAVLLFAALQWRGWRTSRTDDHSCPLGVR
jgi:hypothetical protein